MIQGLGENLYTRIQRDPIWCDSHGCLLLRDGSCFSCAMIAHCSHERIEKLEKPYQPPKSKCRVAICEGCGGSIGNLNTHECIEWSPNNFGLAKEVFDHDSNCRICTPIKRCDLGRELQRRIDEWKWDWREQKWKKAS